MFVQMCVHMYAGVHMYAMCRQACAHMCDGQRTISGVVLGNYI